MSSSIRDGRFVPLGPLHVRPDEEPDVERIDYSVVGPVCYCGGAHEYKYCPLRLPRHEPDRT